MPIERVGFDQAWQRTLFVLDAATPADIPQHFSLSSEYFACLLAWDARTASADEISAVAGSLLDGGAVYVVAWGADCGRVHDIIDENRKEIDGPVVMTTWHEGEELRDAIVSCLQLPCPMMDSKPTVARRLELRSAGIIARPQVSGSALDGDAHL